MNGLKSIKANVTALFGFPFETFAKMIPVLIKLFPELQKFKQNDVEYMDKFYDHMKFRRNAQIFSKDFQIWLDTKPHPYP